MATLVLNHLPVKQSWTWLSLPIRHWATLGVQDLKDRSHRGHPGTNAKSQKSMFCEGKKTSSFAVSQYTLQQRVHREECMGTVPKSFTVMHFLDGWEDKVNQYQLLIHSHFLLPRKPSAEAPSSLKRDTRGSRAQAARKNAYCSDSSFTGRR